MNINPKILTMTALSAMLLTGCGGPATKQAPATPDAAAKQLIESFSSNCPDNAFVLLPKSYQADVNGLVQDFATRMDAELWNSVRTRAQKIASVAKAKRALILEAIESAPNFEKDESDDLGVALDQIISIVDTIATSKFTDLNTLKKGDIGKLLATDGRKTMMALEKVIANTPGLTDDKNRRINTNNEYWSARIVIHYLRPFVLNNNN